MLLMFPPQICSKVPGERKPSLIPTAAPGSSAKPMERQNRWTPIHRGGAKDDDSFHHPNGGGKATMTFHVHQFPTPHPCGHCFLFPCLFVNYGTLLICYSTIDFCATRDKGCMLVLGTRNVVPKGGNNTMHDNRAVTFIHSSM